MSTTPNRYTVVMTAYNEEEWIAGAVRSVLAQTHAELRLKAPSLPDNAGRRAAPYRRLSETLAGCGWSEGGC